MESNFAVKNNIMKVVDVFCKCGKQIKGVEAFIKSCDACSKVQYDLAIKRGSK